MPPYRSARDSDRLLLLITLHKRGMFRQEVRPVVDGFRVCCGSVQVFVPARPLGGDRGRWVRDAVANVTATMGVVPSA